MPMLLASSGYPLGALGTDAAAFGGMVVLIALVAAVVVFGRQSRFGPWVGRIAILAGAAGVVLFLHFHSVWREQDRQSRARDVIVLTETEMWTDAIDMFEDLVRIRFHYRNTSSRQVDQFAVSFSLSDPRGTGIISDEIVISTPVAARSRSSWTVTYWATCPQNFPPATWQLLTHQSIEDFEVGWYPHDLVFSSGEVLP
jgi:hypothetical protein